MRRLRLPFPLAVVLLYGVLWPLMNVAFIAHWYPLPFLTDAAFYRRHAGTVGGPAQYLAGFFTQTYTTHWAGVLALTLLALAAWAVARGILSRFATRDCSWPAAAFAILVLAVVARDLSVLFILPMVGGLAAAWSYVALRDRPRRGWAKSVVAVLFLAASAPLYWLLASGLLYFCAIAAVFELLVRRRPVWSLAWLAVGAAVPYGMSYVLFEPDVAGWYLRWMMLPDRERIETGLVAAMYLFVPVGAVAAYLAGRLTIADRLAPRVRLVVRAAGFAALALLASRLVADRLDTSGWIYADYLREDGRPAEALTSLAQVPDASDPVRFLTLFALARAGRLPWDMFRYPQVASSDALLLRDGALDTNPLVEDWRSDLYLELGRVNDSLRWAHEALAVEGETPRVLERIAVTSVLNGNADGARTFVRALERVPFQAERARQFLAALDRDPGLRSDSLVARIRPLMLRKDYVGDWSTEEILLQCLDANPSNRMAFEYLLAHYLLTSDLKGIANLAPRLKDFYPTLPTHVQEALLGIRNETGSFPPGIEGSAVDSRIALRFSNFLQVYARYQNAPPEQAWTALAPEFGATYWFFYLFGRTEAGPPPEARDDAPPARPGTR